MEIKGGAVNEYEQYTPGPASGAQILQLAQMFEPC